MQHAVLNRATVRVANTRDVSGRFTAKSVMGKLSWLVLVTATMGLYLALPDRGLAHDDRGQNDQGINGTYSVHITGNVPGPLAAAGRVTHFADGTELGVATAAVNGQIQTTTFKGTLKLNPDGVSWSETVIQTSPPFLTLHFILYPTRDGNIINEVEMDPGVTVAGVLTRSSRTADEHEHERGGQE